MMEHKLNRHSRFNFTKTGILIACLSLCFIFDRSFFFYPPSIAPVWNNLLLDFTGLAAGIVLILCGVFGWNNNFLVGVTLAVTAAFLAVLIVAELFHVFGAGYFRFHPDILFQLYTIWNVLQLAYERNPQKR